MTSLRIAIPLATILLISALSRPVPPQQTTAPSSSAQSPASPEHPAAGAHGSVNAPETIESLNLTPEQHEKIKAIREDAEHQIEGVQKDAALSDAKKATKIRQIKNTTRAQIFAVLTPEQQKQWADRQREAREARKAAAHNQ